MYNISVLKMRFQQKWNTWNLCFPVLTSSANVIKNNKKKRKKENNYLKPEDLIYDRSQAFKVNSKKINLGTYQTVSKQWRYKHQEHKESKAKYWW